MEEKLPQLVTNESATPERTVVPKGFQVRDGEGNPVPGAVVWVSDAGNSVIHCSDICDDDGRVTRDLKHRFPARVLAHARPGIIWVKDNLTDGLVGC